MATGSSASPMDKGPRLAHFPSCRASAVCCSHLVRLLLLVTRSSLLLHDCIGGSQVMSSIAPVEAEYETWVYSGQFQDGLRTAPCSEYEHLRHHRQRWIRLIHGWTLRWQVYKIVRAQINRHRRQHYQTPSPSSSP